MTNKRYRITRLLEGGVSKDGEDTYITVELDHAGNTTLAIGADQLKQLMYILRRIAAAVVSPTEEQAVLITQLRLGTDGDDGLLVQMTTDEETTIAVQLPAELAADLANGLPGALIRIAAERAGQIPSAALH